MDKVLFETPEAVSRQGMELFIKCPLYRSKNTAHPIYINEALVKKYLPDLIDTNWDNLSQTITTLFNITLNQAESTLETVGFAYVDKQADPMEIALLGNQGSGRAYYTGSVFNIKGEKTPLATSTNLAHSNGVLAMGGGIWSTIVANSLFEDIESGVSPVMAILDRHEIYVDPVSNRPIKRVIIVRLDIQGSLDRISHILYRKKGLTQKEFIKIATAFGQLEADKFTHRILHSSWSNGNISPDGHLIDYDSVCAVKGRQPQFNGGSSYYIDNFFSFEYIAKLKVLACLINEPDINIDKVKQDELERLLLASRDEKIATQLLHLMGIIRPEIGSLYQNELKHLANEFISLSRYVRYTSERSFFNKLPIHFFAHLFDFSNFFRFYPLLKLSKQFTLNSGFNLLVESHLIVNERDIELVNLSKYQEENLKPNVLTYLTPYFIQNDEQAVVLKNTVYQFLEKYDRLFDEISHTHHLPLNETAAHAYKINEDRFYLFPVFDLSYIITNLPSKTPPETINNLIQSIIEANKRKILPNATHLKCDMRLYLEGISHVELNKNGFFKIIFTLNTDNLAKAHYSIEFNGVYYDTTHHLMQNKLIISSIDIPIQKLLIKYTRDDVFKIHKYKLFCNSLLPSPTCGNEGVFEPQRPLSPSPSPTSGRGEQGVTLFLNKKEIVLNSIYKFDSKIEYYL